MQLQTAIGKKKMNKRMLLIKPSVCEAAYNIAGDIFLNMYKQVTGKTIASAFDNTALIDDGTKDLVVIGSDSVNTLVLRMITQGAIGSFNIRRGSDDYQLLSVTENNRRILFIVGGCGRSTIYAVYDFFQRRADVRYFWDGDIIPRREEIDISGLNVIEKPHFEYRGLRYFAHRGLYRFQAEHWSFDDWKKEIDWIMKKRLNLFMLRIGLDDLFQRAFPDIVEYPPDNDKDPEAVSKSYNDRTSFWPLRERGILRRKVLQYAFERGLKHPEDVGTVTHWYSRTPKALLEKEKITFINQSNDSYNDPSGLVWDINKPENLKRYWHLTQTHINEFGKPDLFHSIGLAERTYGESREENLNLKIKTISQIYQKVKEHYPDAPLMLASWDFMSTWQSHEVREVIKKLDPARTIILDYTADVNDPDENIFTNWDVVNNFPWIFGIFHGLEPENDLRGNYELIGERLRIAANDKACKGMVYWPEFSHGDSFMLEYFTQNAWSADALNITERIKQFCHDRYPDGAASDMISLWSSALKISQTRSWTHDITHPMREINSNISFNILTTPWLTKIDDDVVDAIKYHRPALDIIIENVPIIFDSLSTAVSAFYDNEFLRRDLVDIARMALSRFLYASLLKLVLMLEEWRLYNYHESDIEHQLDVCSKSLELLGQILYQHEDFSLCDTLSRMENVAPINPYSEITLKNNTENGYCRSFYAEFFPLIYIPEFSVYKSWVMDKLKTRNRTPWIADGAFDFLRKKIQDNFYMTPLNIVSPGDRNVEHVELIASQIKCLIRKSRACLGNV